jgi:hypothetical protein
MKLYDYLWRVVSVLIFVLGIFLPQASLFAQTYCYQFDETVVGSKLEVDIILTPSSPFKLGSTTAKFSVNPLSVSLVNPIQFTSNLGSTYTTSVTSPSLGTIDFSAQYTGATGVGRMVPTSGLRVGKMVFNILDPTIPTDIKLLNKGIKTVSLFRDDNTTILAPSAQCPPSPYTSLFYDASIELDADIPMDECVESNTPNSVKLNFGDDETKEILPEGFKFNFYCKEVTSLRLGADGALLVNAGATSTLPSGNQARFKSQPRIIAPWWDEWRKGMGTINCLVKNTTLNGVPTRMLIVQWNGVSPVDNITGSNLDTDPMKATFNVVIFENSSIIKFNYKDIDFTKDIATRPDLQPVVEQKQNAFHGSVGMKGICGTGVARDGVNNIVFDGPIGVTLFDVLSERAYKSITFRPITDGCVVPLEPLVFKVCQNSTPFKIPLSSSAINGRWEGTGVPFLNNPNVQTASFNPTTAGNFKLRWTPECSEFAFDVDITVIQAPTVNAGVDQVVCAGTTVTLAGVVGGTATGGEWNAPSGTFSDVNSLSSTYTPSIASGMEVLTLKTINSDATCPVVMSTVKITVAPAVYAGEDGSLSVCKNADVTTINLFDLIKNEQTGGTWTITTGRGGSFDAAAGTFTTAPDMTSQLFKYTLTGTAPCPNDESRVAINIISPADAGRDGSIDVCDNSTTEIDLRTLIEGEQNNGGWVRLTGTGGVFNANTGKFTPSLGATTSTFKYTVAGFPPCVGQDEAIATVNIAPYVNAGADGIATVCENSLDRIDLNSLITGEQSGGTWVRMTGTGGTFDAVAGAFTPSVGVGNSMFKYTVNGTGACPNASSLATVSIVKQANAGADGSTTICSGNTAMIFLFQLISGEQPGGEWTWLTGAGGNFDAVAGTFTPSSNATSSTFQYRVRGDLPCVGDDVSIVTLTVANRINAGRDGNTTVCNASTATIDLFSILTGEQTGGAWSRLRGTGGDFNAAAGTFTPSATSTNSTFRYFIKSNSPCPDDEAIATVTMVAKADAGADGETTVCNNSTTTINLFSLISGEQAGGTWTRLSGTGGVFDATTGTFQPTNNATNSRFQYEIAATAPCSNDVSNAIVNIVTQVNAGQDGTTTICTNSLAQIDLFSLITGEQTGGVWTRLSGTGGNFEATAGTFTPSVTSTNSTFKYLITGIAPCSNDEAIATINIVPEAYAGTDGTTTVCSNFSAPLDLFSLISGEQTGGVWTRLSGTGGIFNATNGSFTPTNTATSSSFQYSLTATSPCTNDVSVASVILVPEVNAGQGSTTSICSNSRTTIVLSDLITGEQTGGVWTRTAGMGGNFDAVAGTFTPSVNTTNSSFKYTLLGTAPCLDDETTVNINIVPQVNAGTDGGTNICNNSTDVIDLFSLITGEQSGGTWTRLTGSGGDFNAALGTFTPSIGASSSTFQYSLTATVPCANDVSVATVDIVPQADAGADGSVTQCQNFTIPIYLSMVILGEQNGGTWTRLTGTGGEFDPVNARFIPDANTTTSTFQYTVRGAYPCSDDVSVVTVNMIPAANAGTNGEMQTCEDATRPIDLYSIITGEERGGTWIRLTGTGGSFNAGEGSFTPTVGATSSTFQYTVLGLGNCSNDVSVANITVFPKANAGNDANVSVCSNSTSTIDLYDLITGEQRGGLWTRETGTGGNFNAAAGTFTPSANTTYSVFKYAINGGIACANNASYAKITFIQKANAGTNGSLTICRTETAPINLFNIITGEQTGGTWTRVTGTGGVFNASTGSFTPTAGATSAIFRYSLPGISPCSGSESLATINILEQTVPSFSPITICQNDVAPILPTSSLNGVTGTWSPAAIDNQTSRIYTFTPTSGFCATSATLPVTVKPNPKPNAGADQITCIAVTIKNFTLNGSSVPVGATGTWSFVNNSGNGASFIDKNNPKTIVTNVNTAQSFGLVWSVNTEGCVSSDTVMVGKDNTPPTIDTYDKNAALSGSILEKGGEAYVCANILIKELTDNCSLYSDLFARVKIVRDSDNPSRTYSPNFQPCIKVTCADVNKKVLTQVWVTDRMGNANYKLTYISVQDNIGFCGSPTPQATVSITTETNRPVNNVSVTADRVVGSETANISQSNEAGIAKFQTLTVGEKYTLKASKTDESYLGVTTYDISAISQHILGTKPLTSPYTLLAADVNEDGEIDGSDVLILRNFILRRLTSLPRRNWRFVDSSYVFIQPRNPFAEDVPEIISFTTQSNTTRKAFKAVKKGDVFSPTTSGLTGLSVRNNASFTLQTGDILLEKGENYAIKFTSEDFKPASFQFTLNFTEGGINIDKIERGDISNMAEGNFGLFKNAITASWNGKVFNKNVNLFTLHFTANKTGLLSEILSLGGDLTPVEAIDAEGNSLAVQLKFTKAKTLENEFALHQNYPNPFDKQTKIAFNLPKSSTAKLTIYNANGQILYTKNAVFQAGLNEVSVEKNALNTEGVLYYRLDTPEYSATRKMTVFR